MHVQKTFDHSGITLAHGRFEARETVHVCAAGCRKDEAVVTCRQRSLADLLPPRSTVGYDVLVFVGLQRFVHHRQREEIRTDLVRQHGIDLSTGEISTLAGRFLVYLEALHRKRAPALRDRLAADGGWPMHVDATGEGGRGTLLVIYAGSRHWVLAAAKIPTERADAILHHLHAVPPLFGPPCSVMRDLGRAVIEAAWDFVASLGKSIPVFGCHMHFVSDVGKDLFTEAHDSLRGLFRRAGAQAHLRALARSLGRDLGTEIDAARREVQAWLASTDKGYHLPKGRAGLAVVRALVQWVLDYQADGHDEGFPFDLPYLDLYERCRKAARAAEAFLFYSNDDVPIRDAVERLHRIVVAIRHESFSAPVRILRDRWGIFTELRDALRVQVKRKGPDIRQPGVTDLVSFAEQRSVEAALENLTASLRARRPERGPATERREGIDILLDHLDRHGTSLSGHAIALPDEAGGGVRLVERSNIILERFFRDAKHDERRRSGRKCLTQDLEQLPPAAMLARNIEKADYVEILCGSLDGLPAAFAELDASDRSRALPARRAAPRKADIPDCPQRCEPSARSAGDDRPCEDNPDIPGFNIASASMPRADRQIFRAKDLDDLLLAASHCRVPRFPAPQATVV